MSDAAKRAVQGLYCDAEGERIAIDITAGEGNVDSCIVIRRDVLIFGGGRVIRRIDGDGDGGCVGAAVTVGDGVLEGIIAVVVDIRHILHFVADNGGCAVRRICDGGDG